MENKTSEVKNWIGNIVEVTSDGFKIEIVNSNFINNENMIPISCNYCNREVFVPKNLINLPLKWSRIVGAYDPIDEVFEVNIFVCDKHIIKVEHGTISNTTSAHFNKSNLNK